MELTAAERSTSDAAAARDAGLTQGRRRREGIVHTPPELARFVARAADDLLRAELGLRNGLADASVALIDPACGPGAFLAAALAVAQGQGRAPHVVHGIDRDARAIEVARVVLCPELEHAGWRCRLQALDTLVEVRPQQMASLAPYVCVLGNPPWVSSAQRRPEPWLDALLEDFRCDERGVRLEERKLGVLSDAYVRFLRWACEVARLARRGAVVALVTNGSYLDGPVHRALRAALRRFFDAIHVLDLGGNALLPRSGRRDDNVFGVRPTVAVVLGVRKPDRDEGMPATVRYLRLFGPLEQKLERLAEARVGASDWCSLDVDDRYQRFVPTTSARDDYASWPSLADAMPFHREGVQTNRDAVVIDEQRERLVARLRAFAEGDSLPGLGQALLRLPHYDPERARAAVRAALARDPDGTRGLLLRPIAYRRFDRRWFAPIAPLCHRPRGALLAAMDRSGFALVTVRKDRGDRPWDHFGAATCAIDNCFLSTRSSCRARAFPTHDPSGRENLGSEVALAFAARVGRVIASTELCQYALAVIASPAYRERHDQALRIDYPRIPLPSDRARFEALSCAGSELAELLCRPLISEATTQALAQRIASLDELC
jgi:hypothetical protein